MTEYDVQIDASRELPQAINRQVLAGGVTLQTVADVLIPAVLTAKCVGMDFYEFMSAVEVVWDYLPEVEEANDQPTQTKAPH